jgi:hypothetical protein
MWMRAGAAVLAAALVAGCDRGQVGGAGKDGQPSAEARRDSSREVQQALRDSGVSVDTQKIDTGTARTTPVADN